MEEFLLPCLNKQLLGIECFGCGAQRATVLFSRGEFSAAFHMYPAIYSLLFLLGFLIFNIFVRFKNDYSIKIGLILVNAVIIMISYVIKMNEIFQLTN